MESADKTMNKAGMSEMAKARCRRLVISDLSLEDRVRFKLEVFDPRQFQGRRAVRTNFASSQADLMRIKRSLMGMFRIPEYNVMIHSKEEADANDNEGGVGGNDASGNAPTVSDSVSTDEAKSEGDTVPVESASSEGTDEGDAVQVRDVLQEEGSLGDNGHGDVDPGSDDDQGSGER